MSLAKPQAAVSRNLFLSFILFFSFFLSLTVVPAGSLSRGGDVTVYVLHINQPSLPTLYSVLVSVSLSLWPFQLYFIP